MNHSPRCPARPPFVCVLVLMLLVAGSARAAVTGRYVIFGNALNEPMGLVEFEVYSGGRNIILNRPEVFTGGLDYGYWMMRRTPEQEAQCARQLTDGDTDTEQRKVDFGSKVSCGYLDIAQWYGALALDLGEEVPVERIGVYRSRHRQQQHNDLGWRYLVVLDKDRRIVARDAWNVYGEGWRQQRGIWLRDIVPATGAPAGRVVPPGERCWLSEAEYIRDFLGKPPIDLVAEPTPEDRARLARFRQRHEPAAVADLGRRFFRLVDLDRPHLAAVKKLVAAERYPEAFAAFRGPFLDSLAILRQWNAGDGTSIYRFYAWTGEPDTRAKLRARDLRNHVYADRGELVVKRFEPGLLPPAKIQFPFQTRPLLVNYAANNDVADLRLWETLTEDWAMGFQDAADRQGNLRDHFVLSVDMVNQTLKDLYMAQQTNPEFVNEVSGAALARLLMPLMEELPVGYWRVTRKTVFNHNFNAVAQAYLASRSLADFHAGQRLEREVSQALSRLHTLAQYRDGFMVELADEGHFVMNLISPANLYGILDRWQPAWFTPAMRTYFLDNYRQGVLAGVRHVTPSGAASRWPGGDVGLNYLGYYLGTTDVYWRNVTGMRMEWGDYAPVLCLPTMREPEVRAVVDTVYGQGRDRPDRRGRNEQKLLADIYTGPYQGKPSVISDWLPYSGCWYFRRGWDREDSYLHMMSPPLGNSHNYGHYALTQGYEANWDTTFRFIDYATPLLSTFAVEIDKQAMCTLDDTRFPSGSKQDTFTQATEKPLQGRWYTGPKFDFGEATRLAVFRNIDHSRKDPETSRRSVIMSPIRIADVSVARQIFQVRPARLFLTVDRIAYATPEETHDNRIQTTLLLTEPGEDTGKEFSDDQFRIDPRTRTIASRNPGNPGVTVVRFGQPDLDLQRISVNATSDHFWRRPDPEIVDPKRDMQLFGPADTLAGPRRTSGRGVFANWRATGSSVLLTAIAANAPGEEPLASTHDVSTDAYAGLVATTTAGVNVCLLVARRPPATLTTGEFAVVGEALLWVYEPGEPPAGIVLGATAVTVAGTPVTVPGADFVFTRAGAGLATTPIHRPVDPPTVGPAVNTFTRSTRVTLTSATPGVAIHYTTDGSDPTPESPLYRRPFKIGADTLVKARAFRAGAAASAYAGVDASAVSYGFFQRRPAKPAVDAPRDLAPGLDYEYLEGRWFALWTYTNLLDPKATGTTDHLLDVSMRATDEPFAVRYRGYVDVPRSGVYTFYGPDEFINDVCAPGYDLRVFVDGEEWALGQTWHGRGQWSVPLEKGHHELLVTFADARAKDLENQRIDLWRLYPWARTTWKGVAPTLEISGPDLPRQPLPDAWLYRNRL